MSIPMMKKDLAIIQKLSDLPNVTDGLSAAELKAKFDEAGLAIQSWINDSLLPALKAENLPFTGSDQLNAADVQEAIEMVFEQVRGASSGTIANGSVTKEKLASELLERVFGGRLWVSLDKPAAADCPDRDFPVGQIWLRPGFAVENAAGKDWNTTACTVEVAGNQVKVTGNQTYAQVHAVLNMPNLGQDGDRVYVLFGIKDRDGEMTSLTLSINGGEGQNAAKGIFAGNLAGGALSLDFQATWPSSSLAKGSFTVENLAVVNVSRIMGQLAGCREMSDWGSFLQGLLPLESHYEPRAMYLQTAAGVWQQFDYEVFPVSRGGMGVKELQAGEMVCGTGGEQMHILEKPQGEHSLLQFSGGMPGWKTPDEVAETTGFARCAEDTYTGSGVERTIQLPHSPAVLWLRTEEQTYQFFQNSSFSGSYKGTARFKNDVVNQTREKDYTAGVTLEGDQLKFWKELPTLGEGETWLSGDAVHFNETDKQYIWTAL